jgi:predicted ATP-grasp superfamily ATP-dependent carboligase
MNAIVLDGGLKSALAAVRSLGRRGIFVSAAAERKSGMALHSRYVRARFVYPSPYTDSEGFVRAVKAEAVRLGGKPVIYTFSDATYLALYAARESLREYATLVYPPEKSVEIAFNKAATHSIARLVGVPTITTHMLESREEVARLAETLSYPAVIKTRRSVTWHEGKGVFGSASFVHTREGLVQKFTELKDVLGEAPLIQDLIRGEEYGVEMIADDGVPRACIVHHRMRSLSPTGGASVLKEVITEGVLHDQMVMYADRLVKELAWSGPVMVEFKVDADSREPKLMEINGRFWGSLPLSIAAGIDMPYYYFLLATGGEFPEAVSPRHTVTRHFLGDAKHLLRVLFARDKMRSSHYPKRMTAMREFFKLPTGTQSDVWDWRDPKPAFMEVIDILKRI